MEEEKKKKKKNAGSSGALSFLAWNLIFGQDLPGPVIAGPSGRRSSLSSGSCTRVDRYCSFLCPLCHFLRVSAVVRLNDGSSLLLGVDTSKWH